MKKPDEVLREFKSKLAAIPDKKKQVIEIIDFVLIYSDTYGQAIVPFIEDGIGISKEIGFEEGEIVCYYNLLFFGGFSRGKISSTKIELTKDVDTLIKKIKPESEWFSFTMSVKAFFHWFNGDYEKGFNTIFEGLSHTQDVADHSLGWSYFTLAVFYFDTKDLENSQVFYKKAYDCFIDKNEYGLARASNGMASVAIAQNRTKDALPLLEYAAEIYRKYGHYSGLSRVLNDMGIMEKTDGNYEKAIPFLNESIALRIEIEHAQGLVTSYTELGETYLLMESYTSALEHFEKGLSLAFEVQSLQKQIRLFKLLYDTYKKLNNTDLALKNFEKFYEIKSQLMSDEAANNIKKIQTKFEKEKSEKEAEIERLKNVELKKANAIIEQKNKDITDSIAYALRIQTAILPPQKIIKQYLENSFILYQPKDIVAGDFYWMETINDLVLFAACDCTGHGVPGAMVSVVCHNALNRAVREFGLIQPAAILNKTAEIVIENFSRSEEDIKDGMDISFCSYNNKTKKLEWAGANNPLWLIQNGELTETKGDKQPIGMNDYSKPFTNHAFTLNSGDVVYLFTDGFADQFGGETGQKKLTRKRFKELALSIQHKSLPEQGIALDEFITNYRKEVEQLDDILVMAVKA